MKQLKSYTILLIVAIIINGCCNETNNIHTIVQQTNDYHIEYNEMDELITEKIDDYEKTIKGKKKLVFLIDQINENINQEIVKKVNLLLDKKNVDYMIELIGKSAAESDTPMPILAERLIGEDKQLDIMCCGSDDVRDINPYEYCIQKEYLEELDGFLNSTEGSTLLNTFSNMVWDRVRYRDGKIYGINNCEALGDTVSYAYNPVVADYYNFDFTVFDGTLSSLEDICATVLKDNIAPIYLERSNLIMTNYLGLDSYKDLFVISHENGKVKAYNFLEDMNVIKKYIDLGRMREKGFLTYSDYIRSQYSNKSEFILDKPCDSYTKMFVQLNEVTNWTSNYYTVNINQDEQPLMVSLYIPKVINYTYINNIRMQTGVLHQSQYKRESMDFLQRIYTDGELGQLLAYGIEGKQYIINTNRLTMNSNKEAGYATKVFPVDNSRFFPVDQIRDKFLHERKLMNDNIHYGALYGVEIDFGELQNEYDACVALFEEYSLAFIGYYEEQTEAKLRELSLKLKENGYNQLIDVVNNHLANK